MTPACAITRYDPCFHKVPYTRENQKTFRNYANIALSRTETPTDTPLFGHDRKASTRAAVASFLAGQRRRIVGPAEPQVLRKGGRTETSSLEQPNTGHTFFSPKTNNGRQVQ